MAAYLLAAVLLTTGTLHFAAAGAFESIVPDWLGSAAFWVAASGVAELACALGLAWPATRRLAAWAAVALFVVVFPGNITMVVHAERGHGSELIAWARLPLQVPLVLWAWWIARRTPTAQGEVVRWPLSPAARG